MSNTAASDKDAIPGHVLVAVPHKAMASIIVGLLRGIGVKIISEAYDSTHAAKLLADRKIDAMVLDNEIGPEDGIKLTRRLRMNEGPNKAVPIIMISGDADRKHILAARDAGIHEFIRLPVSAEILRARLVSPSANPRSFVSVPDYAGPDRRRHRHTYKGPERRED